MHTYNYIHMILYSIIFMTLHLQLFYEYAFNIIKKLRLLCITELSSNLIAIRLKLLPLFKVQGTLFMRVQ